MTIIQARPGISLLLGWEGEHNARQVRFDISDWVEAYGQGVAELIYLRPGDAAPYPVAAQQEETSLLWTVTATDTAMPGDTGRAELRYFVGETLVKSATYAVTVRDAMGAPLGVPDVPGQSWLDQALAAGAQAKESAASAQAAADRAQSADSAVRFTAQELTEAQQIQARENISALGESDLPAAVDAALAQAKATGAFDGQPGKDGTDATVTKESITIALGYTPADQQDVDRLFEESVTLHKDENGAVITGTEGQFAVSDGAGGIKWATISSATGVSF